MDGAAVMKLLLVALALILGALALIAPTRMAHADWWAEMYQVQCIPELDVLELRPFNVNSKIAVQAIIEQRNEPLEKQHGLYVPQWHYRFEDASEGVDSAGAVVFDPGGFFRWPARFTCQLSAGLVELVILPEPLTEIWHSDDGSLSGAGERIESISISLLVAGRLILDDISFLRCEDGARIFKFFYTGGYFTLSGTFGQEQPTDGATPSRPIRPATKYFWVGPALVDVNEGSGSSPPQNHQYAPPLRAQDVLGPLPARIDEGEEDNDEGYNCMYLGPDAPSPHRQPAGPPGASWPRFPY